MGARCLAPLTKLQRLIERGLQHTAALWPDVIHAWRWVHSAAHILNNEDAASARTVQRRFDGLLGAMSRHGHRAGTLAPALEHFVYASAVLAHGAVPLLRHRRLAAHEQ